MRAGGRVSPHFCKRTCCPRRFCFCFLLLLLLLFYSLAFVFILLLEWNYLRVSFHKESIYLFRSTMSDVAMYDEELKGLEEQISSLLRALDSATNLDQRLEKYNKAQDIMKRLHKTHHQFKVEVRLLEGNEQEVYEKRGQIHLLRINQLKMDLQSKKVEETPFSAARENSVLSSNSPSNDGKDEARAVARRVNTIQTSTLGSLAMTERLLNDTETVGIDAAAKLRSQTEQIQRVNENLNELDSDVNRAKKELTAFIRRMMTDRIIILFSVLILIGIITIVVLKVTKK
ncbi:hypothetical protein, conserved [Trypanosoma cruzi]|uniref:t-SNARE coiled-coil homology domain-containing protein n=2 Tax=Trypanosoma cruzi TaxID=5693 RepID=Q4DCG0_TRYCC|nr:hypothetical protein, conserved [Trypanosoma cruzi]EAN90214.1 hypothetical protein, conserved [Trypanosoma cruzi]|eukprot:XP_812065.1 hypothetical protein [Trypanosoma cruzi strain CL Brener]